MSIRGVGGPAFWQWETWDLKKHIRELVDTDSIQRHRRLGSLFEAKCLLWGFKGLSPKGKLWPSRWPGLEGRV